MRLISKLEGEFLTDADYGKLVPVSWKEPNHVGFVNREIGWLMSVLFATVMVVAVLLNYWSMSDNERQIALAFIAIGSACVVAYSVYLYSRSTRMP
jgi:hypothetical protein